MGVATGVACKWGLAYVRGWAPLELSTHDSSTSTSCRGWYVKRTFTCQLRLAATSRSLAMALSCAQKESNNTLAIEQRAGQGLRASSSSRWLAQVHSLTHKRKSKGSAPWRVLTRLSGAPCNSSDAHPLARVVKVILLRVAQRPIGWKAGTGAAELVPHLSQRFGVIACIVTRSSSARFAAPCGPAKVQRTSLRLPVPWRGLRSVPWSR